MQQAHQPPPHARNEAGGDTFTFSSADIITRVVSGINHSGKGNDGQIRNMRAVLYVQYRDGREDKLELTYANDYLYNMAPMHFATNDVWQWVATLRPKKNWVSAR